MYFTLSSITTIKIDMNIKRNLLKSIMLYYSKKKKKRLFNLFYMPKFKIKKKTIILYEYLVNFVWERCIIT